MLGRLPALSSDNLNGLPFYCVFLVGGSETPADACDGACVVGDHVFDEELGLTTTMGSTNDLLESVRAMKGHTATTLVVYVRVGDVLRAIARIT